MFGGRQALCAGASDEGLAPGRVAPSIGSASASIEPGHRRTGWCHHRRSRCRCPAGRAMARLLVFVAETDTATQVIDLTKALRLVARWLASGDIFGDVLETRCQLSTVPSAANLQRCPASAALLSRTIEHAARSANNTSSR